MKSHTLDSPTVNAVGLLDVPSDFERQPRSYSQPMRLAALLFLLFFGAVTVASTVLSLGAYCLTSDGGDIRALQSSPLLEPSPTHPAPSGGGENSARPLPVP